MVTNGERAKERGKIQVEDNKVQTTKYKITNYRDILYSTGNTDNIL